MRLIEGNRPGCPARPIGMKTTILLAGMLILIAACGGADDGLGSSPPSSDPLVPPVDNPLPEGHVEGPVYDLQTEIVVSGGSPRRVRLDVTGNLPDPCHVPYWTVRDDGSVLAVSLVSGVAPDAGACIEVIQPFEVQIDLGAWAVEGRTITLNGETIGGF